MSGEKSLRSEEFNVVHVSSAHPWTDIRVHVREAASLAAAGYKVCLIAVDNDIAMATSGVTVVKIRSRRRLARVLFGSIEAIQLAFRTGARVVHLHDPELVWAIPLLRLSGRAVIYDAHEDLPSQIQDKHYLPGWTRALALGCAYAVVALAGTSTRVIAATETVAQRFPPKKTVVVRNYPRLRDADGAGVSLSERDARVAYVGAISVTRGAREGQAALVDPAFPSGWKLELAGTFAPPALLAESVRAPGWDHVTYHGTLSPELARDILLKSRVGLCVLQETKAYRDSLPTKMFEYLAAGIPVIASDFPLWRSIVEKYNCGILVDETSPTEIAKAVARYANNPELLEEHGHNARRASLSDLNWKSQEVELIRTYDSL